MLRYLSTLITILAVSASLSYGQQDSYRQLSLDVGGATSILENTFSQHWNPSPSLHLGGRINYHLGNLEAGVRYTDYSANDPSYEGRNPAEEVRFTSYFVYIGWEYPFTLSEGLTFAPGLRFGNNFLTFKNTKTYPPDGSFGEYVFDPKESEFTYELLTRLEYSLGDSPWALYSTFSYSRTLTYHPMTVGLLSVGVSYSFSTPGWIKNFLQ
ncbi:outer membrane beta-barrel protein [Fodinibius salsisoli]|uniref:Outer membrane protein beta-barrel domain-containing protein n=1 Tax=Fodinibius salsisoli TaxID=2820877 RepID=A0ABT3PTM0_9BACT|nr:outer membrane beta-barrel protein [Fodinibius salsisoli]MCW9709216.1 hypothetical protein [Fodinibius salsisoli]